MCSRLAGGGVGPYYPRAQSQAADALVPSQDFAMLNSLRKYATGWVAQLLMGILVLSFAVWGVSDIFTGFRSNAIAQVGSTDINVVDFQRQYDAALQGLSQQFGTAISQEQARQMGIPTQVLGRLVNQATLDEAASELGLGMSNEVLGHRIASDPQFFGTSGTFDRGYLTQLIRAQGLTEDEFIIQRRGEYIRAQLGQAFAGALSAPDAFLRAVHEYRNEERDISYVVVTAPPVSEVGEPTETALTAYFDEHKADWSAPELRAISYFMLSPGEVARALEVTDEEAKARYDASPERFTTVERRKVEQIVFPDRAEAEAAAAEIAGGLTFEALMAARSLKAADVDLGLVTRAELVDPAIADAAFALAANAVSPVVDGRFGPAIVRVTTIEPAVVTTFEQAKADLKAEIANERAAAEISDMHDAIEDARAGGDTLAEVAKRFSLTMPTVAAVDETGKDGDGNVIANVPAGLLAAAFQSDVGLENDPIQPDRNSYAWFEVTALTEPRERPLTEVRDKVVAAWKEAERQRKLTERAEALRGELQDRRDIAAVAAELFLPVKTAKVTRTTKPDGDLSTAALGAAFEGPKGAVATADGAQPLTAVVLLVDNVVVPPYTGDAPDAAQTREQLDSQFTGDLLGMYVTELQGKTDVRFNQAVLQQVLGATAN